MVKDVEAGAEDCRGQEFRLLVRWQAEKDGPMAQFKPRVRLRHLMMFGGKQMILDKGGLKPIRCSIDNAAVPMYPAGHEPRARRYLAYGTLEYRTYSTHIVKSLFDDGPFRRAPDNRLAIR